MRIEHVERPRLRGHVAQHERIDGVLQDVGRPAGVEGVAIAQHAGRALLGALHATELPTRVGLQDAVADMREEAGGSIP